MDDLPTKVILRNDGKDGPSLSHPHKMDDGLSLLNSIPAISSSLKSSLSIWTVRDASKKYTPADSARKSPVTLVRGPKIDSVWQVQLHL